MSSLNQFTMVQLTIDNAEECQIPNPTSQIARPGRVSHSFQAFQMFEVFPRTRNARKNNRTHPIAEIGMWNAECRVGGPRVSKGLSSNSESGSGITNSRTKPVLETFYHPVRRSGVHPSYSRRGACGIPDLEFGILETRDSKLHGVSLVSRFHVVSVFQLFQEQMALLKTKQDPSAESAVGRSGV